MDRARRRARPSRRHRTDRARLVLPRRPRRRARPDHRPRVFRADGRIGALALSHRPQARRPAALRLAVRFPSPPSASRPAFRRSSASRSNCATSSAASRCRDTRCPSKSKQAGASCSPSSRRTTAPVDNLWKRSCYQEPAPRAIGNPTSCYQEPEIGPNSSDESARFAPLT